MQRIVIGTAALILGAAAVLLALPAAASAQSASGGGCQQIESTLSQIDSTLPRVATNPKALSNKVTSFAKTLELAAATEPTPVQRAVGTFVADLRAAGAGHPNVSRLTSDANAVGTACQAAAAPSGAPATGGGSTAGLQDVTLFGVGAAVVLAGVGFLAAASLRRRHTTG